MNIKSLIAHEIKSWRCFLSQYPISWLIFALLLSSCFMFIRRIIELVAGLDDIGGAPSAESLFSQVLVITLLIMVPLGVVLESMSKKYGVKVRYLIIYAVHAAFLEVLFSYLAHLPVFC